MSEVMNFLKGLGVYKVLKSKRFIVAVVTLAVFIISMKYPDVQEYSVELTVLLMGVAGVLIGGYSAEDAARAGREATLPTDVNSGLREIIDAALEAKFASTELSVGEIEEMEIG